MTEDQLLDMMEVEHTELGSVLFCASCGERIMFINRESLADLIERAKEHSCV